MPFFIMMKLKTRYVIIKFTPMSKREYEYKTRLHISKDDHVIVPNNPCDNEFPFKVAKVVKVNKRPSFLGKIKSIVCKVQNTDLL